MTPTIFYKFIRPAAATFFPAKYNSDESAAMIMAICLQESEFKHRQQLLGSSRNWWQSMNGPATGFAQFEKIGVQAVLEHNSTKTLSRNVLKMFGYPDDIATIHKALVHNDLLAAIWARLALYRTPEPLPGPNDAAEGLRQYHNIWAPGKRHPEKWPANFAAAWAVVRQETARP